MKYKVYEYEEGLENLGKIHPIKITKYGKNFTIEQIVSREDLNKRELDAINAKPNEKAATYRDKQYRFKKYMLTQRLAKERKINYKPNNVENFNEKYESAQELTRQDYEQYFDNEGY